MACSISTHSSQKLTPLPSQAVIPEENDADLNALERVVSGLEGRQQDMTPQRRTLGVLVVVRSVFLRCSMLLGNILPRTLPLPCGTGSAAKTGAGPEVKTSCFSFFLKIMRQPWSASHQNEMAADRLSKIPRRVLNVSPSSSM